MATLFNSSVSDTQRIMLNPEKDGTVIIKTPDRTLTLNNGEVCFLFLRNYQYTETQHALSGLIRYMRQNFTTATLKDTAQLFCYHPNTISTILKRDLGMNFSELLRDIRMEQACHLLMETDLPIV